MPNKRKDDEEFLTLARERFAASHDAESKFRNHALSDLKFYDGDQWPQEIVDQRKADGRPCLTFPVIQQFVRQISNDIRKNKPSPVVTPVGEEDVDTADVMMGLARKIERQSKADVARSYAALYAIITGRGWYRLTTRYESEGTEGVDLGEDIFDQEIYVDRVKNQAGIYPDPTAQKPDYSDMKYCFVVEDLMRAEFETDYPKAQTVGVGDFTSNGDQAIHWCSADTIRVAEYFYVDIEDLKIAMIYGADGATIVLPKSEVPKGAEILKERTLRRRVVCWAKISGVEVLEEKTWPIEWIPIIPVLGEELQIDGETSLSGMVRSIKSAQQQYNYMRTMQTETIALAPRAPYIMAEGQDEGFEEMWASANTRNHARLLYKPVSLGGNLLGAPQRQQFEPAIQATTLAVGQAYEDLKRGSGLHDASMGAQGNETSGRAILARQQEGDTANFHFQDNLTTSITHECRMTVALMRHIYDRPGRIARIIGEEGQEKSVTLNQQHMVKGEQKIFDITSGRYDVAVTVGPSYTSKRQQAGELLMQLTKAYPLLMQVAGDLMVKSLDIPGAREIGERLKKMLPPELNEETDDQKKPLPPQVQKQLADSGQMIEQLTAALHRLQDEIDTRKVEMDSRERIVSMQEETKLTLGLAQLDSKEGLTLLEQEIATIRHRLEMDSAAEQMGQKQAHEQGQLQAKQEHEAGAQQAQMGHEQGQLQATQDHASQQADAGRAHEAEQAAAAAEATPEAA